MFSFHRCHAVLVHVVGGSFWIFISLLLVGCGTGSSSSTPPSVAATGTPGAETAVGERLFLDTRFAQSFKVFLDNGGDINDPKAGDSVVEKVEALDPVTFATTVIDPGPFKGMSINCRSCHFVDDVLTAPGGGMRTYADFARRSPIPVRVEDSKTHTPRNSPALVNSTVARPGGVLFHLDAEFNSMEDLVAATFTGRNFGWLPGERNLAIAHIARVVKGDDGSFDLTDQFGGLPYSTLFTGANADIPDEFRLPPQFRAFIGSGTDQEVFNAVVKVVAAYVNGLLFSQTEDSGAPIRSPFDVFLEINGLPQQPDQNETPLDYSRRLRQLVLAREQAGTLQFVTTNPNRADGRFQFHPSQDFKFRTDELAGLKIFLAEPPALPPIPPSGVGNCIACHAAPNFTDFKLHNTGTTQIEYDGIHGSGQFKSLATTLPSLAARNQTYDSFLPATENHPGASERFRSIPVFADPALTDLGVWNVFANPDMPGLAQAKIRAILCEESPVPCPVTDDILLPTAVARFKTPGLRDLSHSAPYMHNGQFDTLDDIIGFYIGVSNLSRTAGNPLANGAAQLRGINLGGGDVTLLVAFLKSLNEDYQ